MRLMFLSVESGYAVLYQHGLDFRLEERLFFFAIFPAGMQFNKALGWLQAQCIFKG